jgi:hypothetical protein
MMPIADEAIAKKGRFMPFCLCALELQVVALVLECRDCPRFKIDGQLPVDMAAKARITGRIVQFPAHDAVEIESYLAAVRQAGLVAEDVEIRKADLEDVFLDVMSEGKA